MARKFVRTFNSLTLVILAILAVQMVAWVWFQAPWAKPSVSRFSSLIGIAFASHALMQLAGRYVKEEQVSLDGISRILLTAISSHGDAVTEQQKKLEKALHKILVDGVPLPTDDRLAAQEQNAEGMALLKAIKEQLETLTADDRLTLQVATGLRELLKRFEVAIGEDEAPVAAPEPEASQRPVLHQGLPSEPPPPLTDAERVLEHGEEPVRALDGVDPDLTFDLPLAEPPVAKQIAEDPLGERPSKKSGGKK